MSTVSETHDVSPAASGDAHAGAHDHPSDLKYVKIAIILAVLTAAEVSTYTFDVTGHLLVAILIPMMIVKFAIVAGYFMHLKFDSKLFTTMFVAGLAFAVAVYCVLLTMFEFW
jgi:cytochrome c oxidase subunit 4